MTTSQRPSGTRYTGPTRNAEILEVEFPAPVVRPASPQVRRWNASATVVSRGGLLLGDAFAFAAAVWLVVTVRGTEAAANDPAAMVGAAAAWLLLRMYAHLYDGCGLAPPEELRRSVVTTAITVLAHSAILFATHETAVRRSLALGTWLPLLPLSFAFRSAVKAILMRVGLYGRPIVVAGAGTTGALIVRELLVNRTFGLIPVAFFDDDPAKFGTIVEGVPVVGPLAIAPRFLFPYPVRDAILAIPAAGGSRVVEVARNLAARFRTVRVVPDLAGVSSLWVRAGSIGTCLTLEVRTDRFERANLLVKRGFDLAVVIPLLVLAAPIVALAAVLVRIVSPGPAFFAQPREGQGGRRIKVWKIRTMVRDAESALALHLEQDSSAQQEWQLRMKLRRDPRVIPYLGAFLRRMSIDELPQLWNVLRGEMSLVGPRPFPDYHLDCFGSEFRRLRCEVPPGITGFWQVTVRSEADMAAQEAADAYYIHNWSLWLDVWIMTRTARVVLAGKGAY
ncbi:MAG: undecaprenyl-phosphate galactose phosphotransferase WbaP [Gemmatimonadaceae bacterium]